MEAKRHPACPVAVIMATFMVGHLVCFLAAGLTAVRFTAIHTQSWRAAFALGCGECTQSAEELCVRLEEPGQPVEEPIIFSRNSFRGIFLRLLRYIKGDIVYT